MSFLSPGVALLGRCRLLPSTSFASVFFSASNRTGSVVLMMATRRSLVRLIASSTTASRLSYAMSDTMPRLFRS